MHLDQVVPWGRSFDEYVRMFRLDDEDLAGRILGVGDGPASFNVEMLQRGCSVISCDPIYQFSPEQIQTRIAATCETILQQARQHREDYVWDAIPSPEALGEIRMAAMKQFLVDYRTPRSKERYVAAALPHLPFAGGTFDLALCSHLLFLYTEQLDRDFHVQAVREMMRVAREVRIFPILDLHRQISSHLELVRQACQDWGCSASVEQVPYEFQRGSNRMLRIRTDS